MLLKFPCPFVNVNIGQKSQCCRVLRGSITELKPYVIKRGYNRLVRVLIPGAPSAIRGPIKLTSYTDAIKFRVNNVEFPAVTELFLKTTH
jgi:hypothetical protein